MKKLTLLFAFIVALLALNTANAELYGHFHATGLCGANRFASADGLPNGFGNRTGIPRAPMRRLIVPAVDYNIVLTGLDQLNFTGFIRPANRAIDQAL